MPKELKPYIFEFETKYTDKSKYIQYNLKDYSALKKTINELMRNDENKKAPTEIRAWGIDEFKTNTTLFIKSG